jgi:hypothetical protein
MESSRSLEGLLSKSIPTPSHAPVWRVCSENYLSVAPFGAGVSSLDAFLGLTPQAIFWSPPFTGA